MNAFFAQATPRSEKTDLTPTKLKWPPGGRREGAKAGYSSVWAGNSKVRTEQGSSGFAKA